VVAGEPPTHLGQIVGTEGEELRCGGDLAGGEGGAGYLDHRADRDARRLGDGGEDRLGFVAYRLQLPHRADERHHDLRARVRTGCRTRGVRLGERADLHGEQAGDDQPEAYPAQAQHRVLFVDAAYRGEHLTVAARVLAFRLGRGHLRGQL